MITLYFVILPIVLFVVRLILIFIVKKFGKFSYDGFSAAGFAYNSEKDLFYSTRNAWQKNFGYTHLYDVMAPVFRMIIDTEPVRFYYDNRNWLITFWKGQYGMVTGAEVGIYYTNEEKVNKKTVYMPAKSKDMLYMDMFLYKKDKLIMKVSAKHWWLAIFKLGMFSWPEDLTMYVNITFLDREMLEAFLKSFKKLRHRKENYKVIDNTFCFKYTKPRTRKVWTRGFIVDHIRQFYNRKNCELYNSSLNGLIDDDRKDDYGSSDENLIMITEFIPDFLKNSSERVHSQLAMKEMYDEGNVILIDGSMGVSEQE